MNTLHYGMASFNASSLFEMHCEEDDQKGTLRYWAPLVVFFIFYTIFMLLVSALIIRYYIRRSSLCRNTWCSSIPV